MNNAYCGPLGGAPFGVTKTSLSPGSTRSGQPGSVYAPPGKDPDINAWNTLINVGEPYQEATIGPIADAVTGYRSGHYWLDPAVEPAPTLFD